MIRMGYLRQSNDQDQVQAACSDEVICNVPGAINIYGTYSEYALMFTMFVVVIRKEILFAFNKLIFVLCQDIIAYRHYLAGNLLIYQSI